jgi:hypothetical protein
MNANGLELEGRQGPSTGARNGPLFPASVITRVMSHDSLSPSGYLADKNAVLRFFCLCEGTVRSPSAHSLYLQHRT